MQQNRVVIYYNKTLCISAIILSVILIVPTFSIMAWVTNGFRELVTKEGFFVALVALLLALSVP